MNFPNNLPMFSLEVNTACQKATHSAQ